MKAHKSLTVARIVDGVKRSTFGLADVGFCVACGKEAMGCEPDARKYRCESCGERGVYGAEELLIMVGG